MRKTFMRPARVRNLLSATSVGILAATSAYAQSTNDGSNANDIIVTAQKRAQFINDVPLSITAASGETLIQRGISNTSDLAKIVPGLTAQPSPFNTPVYTLRGVGFYDSTLSAPPTVAVYTDEVALPFSAMTRAASLDLERVEVLKGPQGTLFGQNTTGGAINYVAAKPTDQLAAGITASYGRFNAVDLQGYLSGPLGSNLKGRLSLRVVRSDDWQESYVRSDSNGSTNELQGRLLLDWQPTDRLNIAINVNGWIDKSDTQAAQRIDNQLSVPTNVELGAPTLAYPLSPRNARAADWTNSIMPLKKDDYFFQGSVRGDLELSDDVTLTSITAYQRYKTDAFQDFDGIALSIADIQSSGYINSFSQELRIAGSTSNLEWVVGGNYAKDRTYDELIYYYPNSTTGIVGPYYIGGSPSRHASKQNVRTIAAFANIEYEILPDLRLQAGARYTENKRTFEGCTYDIPGPNDQLAAAFEYLQEILRGAVTPIPPGGCVTLDENIMPADPAVLGSLKEDNISWRAGINYRTGNSGLVYATISKGYKAGSFPTSATATTEQFKPVRQESLMAYEIGFKQPIAGNALQINAAAFYYDYKNKQLRGRIKDPIFGPLDALVQIPKSRIKGVEVELISRPVEGLNLSVAGSYIDTKIERFTGYNSAGIIQNFAGSEFPYSPKWTVVSDGEYRFPVSSGLEAFVGASLTHNSRALASIGNVAQLKLRPYSLIDVRAGVADIDGKWSFQLWGRNITNEYYWVNAMQSQDGFVRYAGKPVTYGALMSYHF